MTHARRLATVLCYAGAAGAAVAIFGWLCGLGEALPPPSPHVLDQAPRAAAQAGHPLARVLLVLVTVVAASRGLGAVFRHLRQPPVIGEIIAGIMLGPSLLGAVAPELQALLMPAEAVGPLGTLAQLGVILYMFFVGLELDTGEIRRHGRASLAISHASIVLPFLLGSTLALWLYPRLSAGNVSFTHFALFMGVAMSVTAFPVLARLLTDRGMQRSPLGMLALACAAVDDATAWCLLALVVGIVRAHAESALLTLCLAGLYVAGMLGAARPLLAKLARWHERGPRPSRAAPAAVLIAVLSSALATEAIGIHALFGAFLLGALIPHDSLLARELAHFEALVVTLLLPTFFALTGLRTELGLLASFADWMYCAAIIGVACVGKFGGSMAAARLTHFSWRDSAALGVLMNTRGLMEFVVLNIGLDLGVISPRLFTMLVIMAVVTTVASGPLLELLDARRRDPAHSTPAAASAVFTERQPS